MNTQGGCLRAAAVGCLLAVGVLLTGCVHTAPAATAQTHGGVDALRLPSLPVSLAEHTGWGPLPATAQAWLVDGLQVGHGMPREVAQLVASAPVATAAGQPFHARHESPALWVRHFRGQGGAADGVALYARVDCSGLRNLAIRQRRLEASTAAAAGCTWLSQQPAGVLDTGARLYRIDGNGRMTPQTRVAGRLFPAPDAAQWQRLLAQGAGEPFLDAGGWASSNASAVLLEQDPERELPADMPGYGQPYDGAVLGGWLRWDGQDFVVEEPSTGPQGQPG